MKKFVSRMIAAGGIAMLAGSVAPLSSARAQTLDTTAATIECSIRVEETALRCKEATLKILEGCEYDANGQGDVAACDKTADSALTKCELTGAAGDIRCRIDPNSGLNTLD